MHPKFLSLLLTGENSYRRDKKGLSQKVFESGAYPIYLKVVHIVKLPLACSEFNMHMQSTLSRLICKNKGWVFT